MYRQYQRELTEYLDAQTVYNTVINEYDLAFQKAMPHCPSFYGTKTSTRINRTEEFIIEVERKKLKERAKIAKLILDARRFLLDLEEEELRKSYDIYDVLYTAKWIDHKSTKDIIRDLDRKGFDYSPSQVYAIIKRINNEIC